jgi:hypothetical protein
MNLKWNIWSQLRDYICPSTQSNQTLSLKTLRDW